MRHDELIEAAVEEAGGMLIRPRGEGDSRFAVFRRASDALRAAGRIRRDLGAEGWPTPRPIRVRIALHSGEADLREGGSRRNRGQPLRPTPVTRTSRAGARVEHRRPHGLGRRRSQPRGARLGSHFLKDLSAQRRCSSSSTWASRRTSRRWHPRRRSHVISRRARSSRCRRPSPVGSGDRSPDGRPSWPPWSEPGTMHSHRAHASSAWPANLVSVRRVSWPSSRPICTRREGPSWLDGAPRTPCVRTSPSRRRSGSTAGESMTPGSTSAGSSSRWPRSSPRSQRRRLHPRATVGRSSGPTTIASGCSRRRLSSVRSSARANPFCSCSRTFTGPRNRRCSWCASS